MNCKVLLSFAACCLASAMAMPYPMAYPMALAMPDDAYGPVHVPVHKGYEHKGYDEPLGRVKMQIYRGPSEPKGKHGYEQQYFAPWGYYFTQPEDLKKHGYH